MTEEERVKSIIHLGGEHLKNFKKENITYNMCLSAVRSTGSALYYVPIQYRTDEMYQEACKHGGMILSQVPECFITQTICEYAISSTGQALQYVPEKYKTQELCKKAAIRSAEAYWYMPIDYITPDFVVDVAHQSNYESVSSIPETLKKTSFYLELVCRDPEFIWYIPRRAALTAKIGKATIQTMGYVTAAEAVKARPELLSRLHTSLYDFDTCLNFVNSDYFVQAQGVDHYGSQMCGFNTQEDEKAGRFYMNQKYTETYSLPNMMKWPEVAIHFLAINGYYITFCPLEIITEEMCRVAITSNPHSFEHIPAKFKTKEMCMFAFEREPFLIEFFPEEYITEELTLKAVEHSGFILNHLPERFRTKEVCLIAVSDEGNGKIENVPNDILDKEIVMAYLANVSWGIHELKKIPQELWDYEVCLAAVKKDGDDLQFVPSEFIDSNMCIHAIRKSSGAAKYVPEIIFTNEMALATVEHSQYDFKYIPKGCITDEVCMKALSHGDYYAGTILDEIPQEIITQEMCDLAVEKSPRSLEAVPGKYVTEGMLLSVARRACALVARNFPEHLRTKQFINQLISVEPHIANYLSSMKPID